MKKSLVALAALAVAGVASAQSSVTLFGIVDASISGYSSKSDLVYANPLAVLQNPLAFYGVPGSLKQSKTVLGNSGLSSSQIGFRGVEDLGGGLAASFWLETAITNDDGKKGIDNFNRRSTVSLSGGFGELRLGRDYTPTFWNHTVFDPFGTNGVGNNVINRVASNLAFNANAVPTPVAAGQTAAQLATAVAGANSIWATDNYVRTSNSIGYFLPANLGGFYGQVQYALHENVKQDWVQGSPSKKGRYIGGRFGYANGPLDVAVSLGQDTRDGGYASGYWTAAQVWDKNRINSLNLGASYDFGPVKLFGELSQQKQKVSNDGAFNFATGQFTSLPVSATDKYNGYLLGATIPVGAGLIRASYSHVKATSGNPNAFVVPTWDDLLFSNDTSASVNQFAIGYVHNLSKRTALYATVAYDKIKNGQNNAVMSGGATGVSTGVAYATSLKLNGVHYDYAPKSSVGYDFGIRHSF